MADVTLDPLFVAALRYQSAVIATQQALRARAEAYDAADRADRAERDALDVLRNIGRTQSAA